MKRPFGIFKRVPFVHVPFEVSVEGTLLCNNEIVDLDYFNAKTNLNLPSSELLATIVFQESKIPPIYWNKLTLLKPSADYFTPESSKIGLVNPIESLEFPGFFIIPYFSNYVITEQGIVLKKSNGHEIMASRNNLGYYTYRLTDDSSNTQNRLRHRTLCMAFKEYPVNVDELDVNHKDGIPGNDFLDNLEWCTRSENMNHAYQMGLRSDNIEVAIKDIHTGRQYIFISCAAAARYFGISDTTVAKRAKTEGALAFDGFQYRFFPYSTPWPAYTDAIGKFTVNFPDGEIKRCSYKEAASIVGVTPSSLGRIFRNEGTCNRNGIIVTK